MLLEGKKTIIAQKIRQRVRKLLFLTLYFMALLFVSLNVSPFHIHNDGDESIDQSLYGILRYKAGR